MIQCLSKEGIQYLSQVSARNHNWLPIMTLWHCEPQWQGRFFKIYFISHFKNALDFWTNLVPLWWRCAITLFELLIQIINYQTRYSKTLNHNVMASSVSTLSLATLDSWTNLFFWLAYEKTILSSCFVQGRSTLITRYFKRVWAFKTVFYT